MVKFCALEHEEVLDRADVLAVFVWSPGLVLMERKDDTTICLLALVEAMEQICGELRLHSHFTIWPAAECQPEVAVAPTIFFILKATLVSTASGINLKLCAAAVKDSKHPGPVLFA